jgi:hypothetical protein
MSFIGRGGQCSVVARWGFEDFYSWTSHFFCIILQADVRISQFENSLKAGAAARF